MNRKVFSAQYILFLRVFRISFFIYLSCFSLFFLYIISGIVGQFWLMGVFGALWLLEAIWIVLFGDHNKGWIRDVVFLKTQPQDLGFWLSLAIALFIFLPIFFALP